MHQDSVVYLTKGRLREGTPSSRRRIAEWFQRDGGFVKKMRIFLCASLLCAVSGNAFAGAGAPEWVILLHGLARTKASMAKMERRLGAAGFGVLNVGYPSRRLRIEEIAGTRLPAAVAECRRKGARKIHFVTHSMGGILVRCYLESERPPELGRVVMLAPPNGGSETVDRLKDHFFFKWLNGPAGRQLGTDAESLPLRLPPADFEVGVIAGDRSINWILSTMIPGPDDGKVSVARARLAGMTDFIVIHATHPFIMNHRAAIRQTIFFLKTGAFSRDGAGAGPDPGKA